MKRIWTDFFYKKQENTFTGQDTKQKTGHHLQKGRLFNDLEQLMTTEKVYLKHDLSRRELANALRTNECYLAVAIRKFAEKTINEYINSYRLGHAARLLLESGEETTIESIAYESGFSSQRHFYRLFQSKYNISPAKYRKTQEEGELA